MPLLLLLLLLYLLVAVLLLLLLFAACCHAAPPLGTRRPPTGYKPPSPLSVHPPSHHELFGGEGVYGVPTHSHTKRKTRLLPL